MSARMARYFADMRQVKVLPLPYRRQSGIGVLRLRASEPTPHKTAFFEALKAEAELLAKEDA